MRYVTHSPLFFQRGDVGFGDGFFVTLSFPKGGVFPRAHNKPPHTTLLYHMLRTTLTLLLFSLITISASAQAPAIQWQKAFGGSGDDAANCIRQTADGGYIIAGGSTSQDMDVTGHHTTTFNTNQDYWIVKISPTGSIEWEQSFGGTDDDQAYWIEQTTDGGYIVSGGSFSVDGDVTGSHGASDCWVLKLSPTGGIVWQKSLGGSGSDIGSCVKQTTDGGYIVAGETNSSDGDVTGFHAPPAGSANGDMWVVKLSPSGSTEWENCYGTTGSDAAYYIQQTTDGGYMVAGTAALDGSNGMYCVVKLSTSGTVQWRKTYGGSSANDLTSAQQTADGGYILSGNSYSANGDVSGNHGQSDGWIVKINDTGAIQWQKCLGGSVQDEARTIRQIADGGYIVACITASNDGDVTGNHGGNDAWIVQLSPTGDILWQKTIGGTDDEAAVDIRQTADNGFIFTGLALSHNGDITGLYSGINYWTVKLGPALAVSTISDKAPLTITPKPATTTINIAGTGPVTIKIYNTMGQLIKEATNTTTISVAELPAALYLVRLYDGQGAIVYQDKIIKE